MKKLTKILIILLVIIASLIALLYITGNEYVVRGARIVYGTGHISTFIDDADYFESMIIAKGETTDEWEIADNYNKVPVSEKLQKTHDDLGTAAFLVIKNDEIVHEYYDDEHSQTSETNSFSMAKSITVSLLGKAIKDGFIAGLDQPVSDFYPEYSNTNVTVGDLASMASGMKWSEQYISPFSITAESYFIDDISSLILNQPIVDEPGQKFKYQSGSTQLLGLVIERATDKKLATYASESFWKPMGFSKDGKWLVDSAENMTAKTFCCVISNARDFARFGKLYKDGGLWNGQRILDASFIETAINPRFKDSPEYGYGFWLMDYNNKDIFIMRGILGQYVITIPQDDLIVVRLGDKTGSFTGGYFTDDIYTYIDQAYMLSETI